MQEGNQFDLTRILATNSQESGQWLRAISVPSLDTKLDVEQLRIGIALRIGARICQTHRCRCGRFIEPSGLNESSCTNNKGKYEGHAWINDLIQYSLRRAGISSTLRPIGLCRDDQMRLDRLTRPPFKDVKSLCWDSTYVDTFNQINLKKMRHRSIRSSRLNRERQSSEVPKNSVIISVLTRCG